MDARRRAQGSADGAGLPGDEEAAVHSQGGVGGQSSEVDIGLYIFSAPGSDSERGHKVHQKHRVHGDK